MSNSTEFFGKLNINIWYKLLVYFGGIIFISSLFFPVHGLNQVFVQKFGLAHFLAGLFIWLYIGLADILDELAKMAGAGMDDRDGIAVVLLIILGIAIIIIGFILVNQYWIPLFNA